ncbi:MAG: PQQ-binding-like beta-propeller repeat protein [Planctomycetia bacterium]|nr:PQQ-binding-like beta-propeller repeat protein [Planctomycetia bacterium]
MPLSIVLGLVFAATVHAADFMQEKLHAWHQWRGPLATGVSPTANPPLAWDESTGAGIRWKAAIPGRGSASPIVWGDNVFIVTAVKTDRTIELPPEPEKPAEEKKDQPARVNIYGIKRPTNFYQFVILCLDRATGKVRWRQIANEEVPHEGHHPDHGYASASPTTDGQYLYASFGSHGIFCYDFAGQLKWKRDLGDMMTYASFGEGTSPVIHGDKLVVNWDHQGESFLTVLDARTGNDVWRVPRDQGTTWATPLVVEGGGRTQIIVNATKRTRSYDLATGELVWECGGQVASAIPCPVTLDGIVFCMTGFRGSALYAIPLDAKGDVTDTDKISWHKQGGTPYVPSPMLYDDLLYFTGSNSAALSIMDAKTGDALVKERLQGLKNVYASPVGAAGRVYFTGRDGASVVIKHGRSLEVLATNKLEEPIDASAALVGNQMFQRGQEHLYCLEAK